MPEFANRLDAIPLVATTAERGVLFPSPSTGQRVQNLETGAFERYTGSAWHIDVFTGAVDASAFPLTDTGFKAAVAAAAGGTLLLPVGYSVTTTSETTVAAATRIIAYGATVTCSALGESKAILKITANGVHVRGGTYVGPTLAGDTHASNTYVAAECALWWYGTSGSPLTSGSFEDITVEKVGSYGVLWEYAHGQSGFRSKARECGYAGFANFSSNETTWLTCDAEDIGPGTSSNAYGFFLTARTLGAMPERSYGKGCRAKTISIWTAFDIHGGIDCYYEGCIATGCFIGFNISAGANNEAPIRCGVANGHVYKGAMSAPGRAIGISGYSSGVRATGCYVTGLTSHGMGYGIAADGCALFQNTEGLVLSSMSLYDCRENGVIISDCLGMTMHGVSVYDVTNIAGSNSAALRIQTACTGTITGCWFDGGGEYAVNFNAASTGLIGSRTNYLAGSLGLVIQPSRAGRGWVFQGTDAIDPASVADGARTTVETFTVAGARLGDYVTASYSLDCQGLKLIAWVSATDTVSHCFENETGAPVDLGAGTVAVICERP